MIRAIYLWWRRVTMGSVFKISAGLGMEFPLLAVSSCPAIPAVRQLVDDRAVGDVSEFVVRSMCFSAPAPKCSYLTQSRTGTRPAFSDNVACWSLKNTVTPAVQPLSLFVRQRHN